MILSLAGGVGGAKLALGLYQQLGAELNVVVNTGDDFEHLGLSISPDLDTVMYTLAGLNNRETGWGLANETWNFMAMTERYGGETWFRLGDRDLATHVLCRRIRRPQFGELGLQRDKFPFECVIFTVGNHRSIQHVIAIPVIRDEFGKLFPTRPVRGGGVSHRVPPPASARRRANEQSQPAPIST